MDRQTQTRTKTDVNFQPKFLPLEKLSGLRLHKANVAHEKKKKIPRRCNGEFLLIIDPHIQKQILIKNRHRVTYTAERNSEEEQGLKKKNARIHQN